MSPSSTSSSEQNVTSRRLPLGLLVAVGALLAIELGVARQDWVWQRNPRSTSGIVDALERFVISRPQSPTVLVMGSSRVRDAVIPVQLEQELGVPRGSVLNLGLTGGTPFDALTLYRRNRKKLSQAKVLIFAIEDWHFNAALAPNARDRRFSTLSDRMGVFDRAGTLSMLVGWFWRTYDAQGPLADTALSTIRGGPQQLALAPDGRVVWWGNERNEGPQATDVGYWVESFYRPHTRGLGRRRQLEDLVALARDDGLCVLVVQLPWRDAYVDAVRARHKADFEWSERSASRIAGASVKLYERASALGIRQRWFYDYGHLTPAGARVMTGVIAKQVQAISAESCPSLPAGDPRQASSANGGSRPRGPVQ